MSLFCCISRCSCCSESSAPSSRSERGAANESDWCAAGVPRCAASTRADLEFVHQVRRRAASRRSSPTVIANDSTPTSARRTIEGLTADLWSRRATHADGFAVSLGRRQRRVDAAARRRLDCTIAALGDLGNGDDDSRSACHGARSAPPVGWQFVAKAIERGPSCGRSLMQLAANCGPADVRFRRCDQRARPLALARAVAPCHDRRAAAAVVTETDLLDTIAEFDVVPRPHLVVITDAAGTSCGSYQPAPTSARRRPFLGTDRSRWLRRWNPACVHVAVRSQWSDERPLARRCRARFVAGAGALRRNQRAERAPTGQRSQRVDRPGGSARRRSRDTLARSTCCRCCRRHEPAAIAAAWVAGGADPPPRTVIGVAGDGVVDIDLDRDGPHALMAGTTGAGKSELLRTLVVGLGGGLEPRSPHVRADRLQGRLDVRRLRSSAARGRGRHRSRRPSRQSGVAILHAELRRREQLLRDGRRRRPRRLPAHRRPREVLPRLVVVIDEFAALVDRAARLPARSGRHRSARSKSRRAPDPGHPATEWSDQRRHPRQHQPATGAASCTTRPTPSTSSATGHRRRFHAAWPAGP